MELEKLIKKISIDDSRFFVKTFVVGAILSLTFFLLLFSSARTYRSDILVLVNVKSSVLAKNQNRLIDQIATIPSTLSFYNRLLKFNPDVRDISAGLSSKEKKEKWNEIVLVSRSAENASLIKISVTTSRANDSEQLASKTARTLFDTSAFYYNIKNELSMSVVDGPITTSNVPGLFWILILSVVGGFAISGLLNYSVSNPGKFFISKKSIMESAGMLKKNFFFDFKKKSEKSPEQELESLRNLYESEQINNATFPIEEKEEILPEPEAIIENVSEIPEIDPRFQEMKKITKQIEPDKYPNFPEMPVHSSRVSSAPDNLPIADETFFVEENILDVPVEKPEEILPEQKPEVIEEEPQDSARKEPTAEELKKRLNQLLRGEL